MLFVLLLALAYGTPNMHFPWWVWVLSVLCVTDNYVVSQRDRWASNRKARAAAHKSTSCKE